MNNWEITHVLRSITSTKNAFIGVFPADKIPSRKDLFELNKRRPICLVANTDISTLPGKHWTAVYIGENNTVEFFDSYGRPPQGRRIIMLCGQNYRYNNKQYQSSISAVCGQFCIYFLVQRCLGKTMETIQRSFSVTNLRNNDSLVCDFVHKRFPIFDLKSRCHKFVLTQISRALYKINNMKNIT